MRLLLLTVLVSLIPGMAYIASLTQAFQRNASTWLQNDITIGVLWLSAFPASVGLLAVEVKLANNELTLKDMPDLQPYISPGIHSSKCWSIMPG